MEPLVTNRQCLIWLCVCPADEPISRWQRLAHAIFAMFSIFGLMCTFSACFAFGWKYLTIDVGKSIFAFMFVVGQFVCMYSVLAGIFLLRHKFGAIFDNLATIYKDNDTSDSFRFLAHANNTSEWMWKLYFKFIAFINIQNLFIGPLMSILFDWLKNKTINVENYARPLPYLLPWNQSTPVGYAAELAINVPAGLAYFFVTGTFLLLFISICQHHQAFYKMFKHSVDKLDQPDQNQRCDAKFLRDLVDFYVSVKDWFLLTADVFSSFNAIQLILNEAMVAISIFYLDYLFRHHGFDLVNITAISVSTSNLFIYCYLGKLASESYENMSDCVCNIKWYELPNGLQKYFVLMIANMEIPIYYHAFDIVDLNLETFNKLLKSAISYYMTIKTMTFND